MEFKQVMEQRHSARCFRDDEVPAEVLRGIVRTAERTPSWENSQPWNVYVVTLNHIEAHQPLTRNPIDQESGSGKT